MKVDFATIKPEAVGRWAEVLTYTGIPSEFFNGKHQPCPGCAGTDRARWDIDREIFYCGQGGVTTGGDGFSLLEHCGWSKRDALHAVAQYLGLDRVMYSPEQCKEISKRTQAAKNAKIESALLTELTVIAGPLSDRVTGRQLAGKKQFREARPEWVPPPDETWDREVIAARRIINGLEVRYGL